MKSFKEFLEEVEGTKPKGKIIGRSARKQGEVFVITDKGKRPSQDQWHMYTLDKNGNIVTNVGTHPSKTGAVKFAKNRGWDVSLTESLDESDFDKAIAGIPENQRKKRLEQALKGL